MDKPILLLVVAPDEWPAAVAKGLSGMDVEVVAVHGRLSAVSLLREQPAIDVVLTASILADGTWQDILRDISRLRRPPQVIVGSRLGDVSLWCDVLESGAYDLVAYPFVASELQRILLGALAQGRSQNIHPKREGHRRGH